MSRIREDEPLLVVTAVAAETRAVLAAVRQARRIAVPGLRAWEAECGGRLVRLVQSGVGPARARAALAALDGPHALVLSVGFAGGLIAGPAPGDVVLPTAVVWEDDDQIHRYPVPLEHWTAANACLPSALADRVLHGALLSSPTIVASTEEKHAAGRRADAVAVEMEAAALITLARERGTEVLPLRVILDTADVSLAWLPANLDSSWRARAQLLARPVVWGRVLSLAREVPFAARNLTAALAAVLRVL